RVLGALGGAFGDRWAATHDPLALRMTVRRGGRDLPLDPAALRRAFPLTTGRVVVLIHGLCLTDASWAGPPHRPGFAERLHRDLGADVLTVRYDTGRRIPANGVDLANLLERLLAAWPGGLRELALVGHSMGGLVARSACVEGAAAGHGWTGALRHVVTLGSPHLGAHLERASATASWAAGLAPETQLLTNLLGLRSAGVLDLRHGAIVPEDVPPAVDRWPWGERGTAVPLLEGVRHHALGVTLARDPASWLARTVLGDLLVTPDSATGRARGDRRLAFGVEDAVLLGGLNHFDLLHHPRVYAQLRRWLRPAPGLPAAGATGDGLVTTDAHAA
ncbi:esterase/lipase family protein, partial [Patulibacter sp. S7RM1-6]